MSWTGGFHKLRYLMPSDHLSSILATRGGDESFQQHLSMLKDFYCKSKTITFDGKIVVISEMLSASRLETEQSMFKLTMKANVEAACTPPFHVNPS